MPDRLFAVAERVRDLALPDLYISVGGFFGVEVGQESLGLCRLAHRYEGFGRPELGLDQRRRLTGRVELGVRRQLCCDHRLKACKRVLMASLHQDQPCGAERGSSIARVELECSIVELACNADPTSSFFDLGYERKRGRAVGVGHWRGLLTLGRREARHGFQK